MIWLTWRQSRAAAAMMFVPLAVLAAILGLTGPGLAHKYSDGITACTPSCSSFVEHFKDDHLAWSLVLTTIVLVLPALIGLFWGAPLIPRELEADTHRLVWNQSITRARWLAVKLSLGGLAAMTAAGLGSLAVTRWSIPIDKTKAISPLLFAARGIAPIGYAAFAFVLGVTVGMLVRSTQPAMAITLVVYLAVQIAMPGLRVHFSQPTRSTFEITASNLYALEPSGEGHINVIVKAPEWGAWIPSKNIVDKSGDNVDDIPLSRSSGPCAFGQPLNRFPGFEPADRSACVAEIKWLGYQEQMIYHPSSRFWLFQWYETGIYTALTLGLAGFCFWWIRRLS
ncbi:ABC transporter permease subunit [Protofrankia symbiont of Coriaria ruscifolia]|uniref:ABC transporter permease subunit n=1 Tax=Protofrankia symbiont of Coriaria ruscifolia TaxID=1306542 RepID=UPI0010412C60|nr:ABC transporter permease subunit [Protofrankia symbiont of Coriaria ruscifolia]